MIPLRVGPTMEESSDLRSDLRAFCTSSWPSCRSSRIGSISVVVILKKRCNYSENSEKNFQ